MTAEFIQFELPCKECLVRAKCFSNQSSKLLEKKIDQIYTNIPCLAAPVFSDLDIPWEKHILECISNIFRDWTKHTSRENDNGTHPRVNIPYEYFTLIIEMIRVFEYMINSTSWRTGKLEYFDKMELETKTRIMKSMFEYGNRYDPPKYRKKAG